MAVSWEFMQCTKTKTKEPRKVARVDTAAARR